MKVLHWAFVLIVIVLPVSIVCRNLVNTRFAALKDEVRINNAIDTATKDAIDQIISTKSFLGTFEYDNEFGDVIDVTPELAQESINTFFHTMAVNFNIPYKMSDTTEFVNGTSDSTNSYIKNYFASYVPAVLVIAYDGFYVYSIEQDDNQFYGYKLSSKIPYTYNAGQYTIGYTLGNDIYLYVNPTSANKNTRCYSGRLSGESFEEIQAKYENEYGYLNDIIGRDDDLTDAVAGITNDMNMIIYSLTQVENRKKITSELEYIQPNDSDSIPFLQDYQKDENGELKVGAFHEKRREVIIKKITECLNEKINNHNNYADMMGITYHFSLPEITQDDWVNSINDISVMAFVQGIPMGTANGTFFNSFALGGSQIVRSDFLFGNEYNGVKLYHKRGCSLIENEAYDTIFIDREDAWRNEYYPCQLCN